MPSIIHYKTLTKTERRKCINLKHKIQSIFFISFVFIAIFLYFINPFSMIHNNNNNNNANKRNLLQSDYDDDYYINQLKDFPETLFSLSEIDHGAWLLYFGGMLYCFLGIAVICDDYFVPSIEAIVDRLQMSPDTAGATWMAAGGSAPELFTSFIGTFIAKSDVGFGTIVGSAVFNVLFVVGCCAIFTPGNLPLDWWPFARDITYYLLCLSLLSLFFGGVTKNRMDWWETLILLCLYVLYVFLMSRNKRIRFWFYQKFINPNTIEENVKLLDTKEEQLAIDMNKSDKQQQQQQQNGTKTETEEENENENGNDVTEKDKSHDTNGAKIVTENGSQKINNPTTKTYETFETSDQLETIDINKKDKKDKKDKNDNGDKEDDDSDDGVDLSWPGTIPQQILYIIAAPLTYPMYYTLIDVKKEGKEKYWPWTFFGSLIWLGGLSYFMVWWAVVIGYAWRVPSEVMGLVFLAAGTSVPEMFSCIIVARKGEADMAVSGSIGSNIFDILIGLPLPWFAFAVSPMDDNQYIDVHAHNLLLSILVLVGLLFCLLALLIYNKWVLTHSMGYCMLFLYCLFIAQDLLRQFVWESPI